MPFPLSHSRRGFLRGRRAAAEPVRPPWARRAAFTDLCTRCSACVSACPEKLIVPGDGGFPVVDFRRGECSFCGACASACPQPLFDRAAVPWTVTVAIAPACLSLQRVVCRSCGEVCPAGAIRFALAPGGAAEPRVEASACTGCGACVAVCPAGAVSITPAEGGGHAHP